MIFLHHSRIYRRGSQRRRKRVANNNPQPPSSYHLSSRLFHSSYSPATLKLFPSHCSSRDVARIETQRALSNRSIVRTVNYYGEEREGTLLSLCARERGMDGETKWSVKLQTDIKFLGCGERGEEGGKKAELSRKELKFNDDGTRLNLTSIDPKFNYNYALI